MYYARAFGAALIAALAVCGYWSVRFALQPDTTRYLMLRALQMDYEGRDSTALLERVALLTPLASEPRIRLGLAAEIRGDAQTAERWLLEAASVDQQFEPRWTLANFYFRAGRTEDFWRWMRAALERSYGDRKAIFHLGRRAADSWADFYSRAMPDRPEALASYVEFLLHDKETRAVRDPAVKLAATPGYRALLLAACDALIEAGDVESAASVWTALGEPHPTGVLAPDFERTSDQGFDWRLNKSDGVTFLPLEAPRALRVRLTGQEPEAALLVRQPMGLLRRNARYELHWTSRTESIRTPSGLSWRIAGATIPIPPSADWVEGSGSFVANGSAQWLELWYQRPVGETRAEGSVDLRKVRITGL
jgi:tetratricopeptide (TPR) repeat protein